MFATLSLFREALRASSQPISQPFKRSQTGLFDGKTKLYGNNVPHSKRKTRRTWLPNVQPKRFISEGLGKVVKLSVTTRALRSIKKHGGLDSYLLNTSADRLGFEGVRMRIMVREGLQARKQGQLEQERQSFLEEEPYVGVLAEEVTSINKQLRKQKRPSLRTVSHAREEAIKTMRERNLLKTGELPSAAALLQFMQETRQPEAL